MTAAIPSTATAPAIRDLRQPVRRRTHPASEYWDVSTATWRTHGPVVPRPRAGV